MAEKIGTATLLAVLLLQFVLLASICMWFWRLRRQRQQTLDVTWAQDLSCVELTVPMPESVTVKDVQCIFKSTTLDFSIRNQKSVDASLSGTLLHQCLPDECNWQVWPVGATIDRKIKITVAKADERIWKSLFKEGAGPETKAKPRAKSD